MINWTLLTSSFHNTSNSRPPHQHLQFYVYHVLVPLVCGIGILGNILNLVVLLQRQLHSTMDYMEKSAHMGIVALAVSDMLFCILALPMAFVNKDMTLVGAKQAVSLYYRVYNEPLLNIFLLSSTWLVVIMASARYLAICRPLHARGYINLKGTALAIFLVFFFSTVVNLPQFWHVNTISQPCPLDNSCTCYSMAKATMIFYTNTHIKFFYIIFRAFLGTFIPLIIMSFCNICLIRALRESHRLQQRCRANAPKESNHRITLTLVTMVLLFIVLVCPSTILIFFKEIGMAPRPKMMGSAGVHDTRYMAYQIATHLTNLLQAINFSINFILYCIINVHFRKVMAYVLCCGWRRQNNSLTRYNYSRNPTYSTCKQRKATQMDQL